MINLLMQVIVDATSVSAAQELAYKRALEETLLSQGIVVTDDQIIIVYVLALLASGIKITGEQSVIRVC
jgi:hypothetical protein